MEGGGLQNRQRGKTIAHNQQCCGSRTTRSPLFTASTYQITSHCPYLPYPRTAVHTLSHTPTGGLPHARRLQPQAMHDLHRRLARSMPYLHLQHLPTTPPAAPPRTQPTASRRPPSSSHTHDSPSSPHLEVGVPLGGVLQAQGVVIHGLQGVGLGARSTGRAQAKRPQSIKCPNEAGCGQRVDCGESKAIRLRAALLPAYTCMRGGHCLHASPLPGLLEQA